MAFSETSGQALNLLTQDDARFNQGLTENLRDRTFIIGYLSELVAATPTHAPLYGEDALLCLKLSIPSILYPNKNAALDVGAEEEIANPQFGLPVTDDANSLLTSGVSDFGVIGAFIYPVLISLVASVFLRIVSKRVPEIVKLIVLLMFASVMIQCENGLVEYFDLLRQSIIFVVLCWPIAKFTRRRSKLSRARALSPIPASF
jgi:hypothetical protein